jgi:hypothetical protein
METVWIQDPGWKKVGTGINIPDPQHWLVGLSALMATLCQFANADAVAVILLAFPAAVARLVKLILMISCCCWCRNGLLYSFKDECCDDYQRRFRGFVLSTVSSGLGRATGGGGG